MKYIARHMDKTLAETAQAQFEQLLKGKKLEAFGRCRGLFGSNPTAINVTVDRLVVAYANKAGFVSLDVHLSGYSPNKTGIIFTDETFIASLREALAREGFLNGHAIHYSEASLQHDEAVNLDVNYGLFVAR